MNEKLLILIMIIGVALLFITTRLQADTEVDDTFKMETKELKEHKKGIVEFSHKKHNVDYEISCSECHHDKDGKSLDLKMGDDVQRCIECHTEVEKTKENRRDITLLENVMHKNCVDCHKKVNKEETGNTRKGPAPTSCSKCHPREK